jgi:integrase/recombinase XerC
MSVTHGPAKRARRQVLGMNFTASWTTAIDDYLSAQRAAGAPTTTCATRRQHLEHLGRRVEAGPWQMTADELVDYAGAQEWARETRRGRRSTFRSFWAWGVATGRVEVNVALALPKVPASRPRPRPTPDAVYKHALARSTPRERLMLRLGAEIGLRRAEVAVVHSDDLSQDLVGWSLLVHGKGNRERMVPLSPSLALALRAEGYGFVFPGDDDGHLSPRWVGKLMTNLIPEGFTMHSLRHRFATKAYGVDRDVFAVQELLGHASPATTRGYVVVEHEALRRTVLAVAS